MRVAGRGTGAAGERGFALVLALLALMLLTMLGLALATSTTTEVQVATNYRWEQQALYNTHAGVALGKSLLRTMEWSQVLPPARGATWTLDAPATPPPPPVAPRSDAFGNARRDYEHGECDARGGGVGYGVVLDDGTAAAPYQNKSTMFGRTLNGAFTLWVKRPLVAGREGTFADDASTSDTLILTVEGRAPYDGSHAANATAAVNQSVHLMQVTLSRRPMDEIAQCGTRSGQAGGNAEGTNFSGCAAVGDGTAITVALGGGATGTGAELDPSR